MIKPRTGLQRIFLAFSDGHVNDDDAAEGEAQRLHMSGARIITVAVGDDYDQPLLERVASRPPDSRKHTDSITLDETFVNLLTEEPGD